MGNSARLQKKWIPRVWRRSLSWGSHPAGHAARGPTVGTRLPPTVVTDRGEGDGGRRSRLPSPSLPGADRCSRHGRRRTDAARRRALCRERQNSGRGAGSASGAELGAPLEREGTGVARAGVEPIGWLWRVRLRWGLVTGGAAPPLVQVDEPKESEITLR